MASGERTQKSLKNVIAGLVAEISVISMGFLTRRVLIDALGIEYNGLNGVLANLLMLLTLGRLGIDTAITYSMYKPLADNDIPLIRALVKLYRRVFLGFTAMLTIGGVLVVPFLPTLLKGSENIPNLTLIFFLYMGSALVSYQGAHKRALMFAAQRNYFLSNVQTITAVVVGLINMTLLSVYKNYALFLCGNIVTQLVNNLYVSHTANREYPFIRQRYTSKLAPEKIRELMKNVGAMMSSRLGESFINGTDSVIISAFLGIITAGICSNYQMIYHFILRMSDTVFVGVKASVGHFFVAEEERDSLPVFYQLFAVGFWVNAFLTIGLICMCDALISVWLGSKYIMDAKVQWALAGAFYLVRMQQPMIVMRETAGAFWFDRYRMPIEALVNLGVSLVFVQRLGLVGVFIGTIIGHLSVSFWLLPMVIYKHVLKARVRGYFARYAAYTALGAMVLVVTKAAVDALPFTGMLKLVAGCMICGIVPNAAFLLTLGRTREGRALPRIATRYIKGALRKVGVLRG